MNKNIRKGTAESGRHATGRSLVLGAAFSLALLRPTGSCASAAGSDPHEYASRFQIRIGAAAGLEADSAETHLALGAAVVLNPTPGLGIGIEASIEDLFDEPARHASFGVMRLAGFVELRPLGRGPVLPFVAVGAGLYSWRRCRGTSGGEIYSCSTLHPDERMNASGAYGGAGVHYALSGTRSLTLAVEIHPYTTTGGGRPFAHGYLGFGW